MRMIAKYVGVSSIDGYNLSLVLTAGKEYEVESIGVVGGWAQVVCDDGVKRTVDAFRFTPLPQTGVEKMPDPEKDQSLKKDDGKPPFELLDPWFMLETVKVLGFGAKKYAANGWRKGISYSRVIGALHRHLNAIERGEDCDPETGLLHTAHLACEAMFLGAFQLLGRKDLDDRVKNTGLDK